jgi:hypothetical protein
VVLDWLTGLNTSRRRVEYSLGWAIGEAERAAITTLPASAWTTAIDADSGVRDGAQVAEQTGLPTLPTLPGWPDRRLLHTAARLTRGQRRAATHPRHLALGRPDHRRVHPDRARLAAIPAPG